MPGVSPLQTTKRVLVRVILTLARTVALAIAINRDSPDAEVAAAYRQVARRVHPDKGGDLEQAQQLNAAYAAWQDKLKASRPTPAPTSASAAAVPVLVPQPAPSVARPQQPVTGNMHSEDAARQGFRIRASAVLLTFQGISGLGQWQQFLTSVKGKVKEWAVIHWCCTLERSKTDKLHIHAMLHFRKAIDRVSRSFAFQGIFPNAGPNGMGSDLCGEGLCRKKIQQSIDRGMFYVWADKIGTVRDADGQPCVAGNYEPCWTACPLTYAVLGKWPEALWKQRKLTRDMYESYLFQCRDGIVPRKRNLDAVRAHEDAEEATCLVEQATTRIRSNPEIFKPFPAVPQAQAWLQLFVRDALRYPLLLVLGPSGVGKTEWAKTLFRHPLELKIGSLLYFPDKMRMFRRGHHDGLVLDDVRDLRCVSDNQEKLQGKYDAPVEFASTPGGTCAYSKYLFAVPTVLTINYSTENLGFLESHDWLGKASNRVVVQFPPAEHSAQG